MKLRTKKATGQILVGHHNSSSLNLMFLPLRPHIENVVVRQQPLSLSHTPCHLHHLCHIQELQQPASPLGLSQIVMTVQARQKLGYNPLPLLLQSPPQPLPSSLLSPQLHYHPQHQHNHHHSQCPTFLFHLLHLHLLFMPQDRKL
jgi:hypothetical protein